MEPPKCCQIKFIRRCQEAGCKLVEVVTPSELLKFPGSVYYD